MGSGASPRGRGALVGGDTRVIHRMSSHHDDDAQQTCAESSSEDEEEMAALFEQEARRKRVIHRMSSHHDDDAQQTCAESSREDEEEMAALFEQEARRKRVIHRMSSHHDDDAQQTCAESSSEDEEEMAALFEQEARRKRGREEAASLPWGLTSHHRAHYDAKEQLELLSGGPTSGSSGPTREQRTRHDPLPQARHAVATGPLASVDGSGAREAEGSSCPRRCAALGSYWEQLTPEQRRAAEELGYSGAASWNEREVWEDGPSWAELDEEQFEAACLLGLDASSWAEEVLGHGLAPAEAQAGDAACDICPGTLCNEHAAKVQVRADQQTAVQVAASDDAADLESHREIAQRALDVKVSLDVLKCLLAKRKDELRAHTAAATAAVQAVEAAAQVAATAAAQRQRIAEEKEEAQRTQETFSETAEEWRHPLLPSSAPATTETEAAAETAFEKAGMDFERPVPMIVMPQNEAAVQDRSRLPCAVDVLEAAGTAATSAPVPPSPSAIVPLSQPPAECGRRVQAEQALARASAVAATTSTHQVPPDVGAAGSVRSSRRSIVALLPYSILHHICSLLDVRELGRVAQTCRTLRPFSLDADIWESVLARRGLTMVSTDADADADEDAAAAVYTAEGGDHRHPLVMASVVPNARGRLLQEVATAQFVRQHGLGGGAVRVYTALTQSRLHHAAFLRASPEQQHELQERGVVRATTQLARQCNATVRITLSAGGKDRVARGVGEAEGNACRVDVSAQILAASAHMKELKVELEAAKATLRRRFAATKILVDGGKVAVSKRPKERAATVTYSLASDVWARLPGTERERLSWLVEEKQAAARVVAAPHAGRNGRRPSLGVAALMGHASAAATSEGLGAVAAAGVSAVAVARRMLYSHRRSSNLS
jgi:hypothetical protein